MLLRFFGSCWLSLLARTALAVATTTGTALFLTHNRAGKGLVLGGDFPRELLGVLHGSLLSRIGVGQYGEHLHIHLKYIRCINYCQSCE